MNDNEKPRRVGLYVRVSTGDQNCEMQIGELTAYAKDRGWTIVKVYEDQASGTNPNRKMLAELLNDCRKRRIDIVAVWKLDRLFRSLKGVIATLTDLNDLGIEFIALKDNLDLTTAQGRLMAHLLAAFAEFEVSLIRTRVKAGLAAARARGTHIGRPRLDPALTARVLDLRRQSLSIRQIEHQLGRQISRGSIVRILKEAGLSSVQKGGSNEAKKS